MKKITLLIVFIGVFNTIIAQDYTPMLELGKVWNMHHYDNVIPPNNYDFNISLDNLTTINGTEYFEASNGDLFREDIVTKKVYKRINDVDVLILDFDLVIGNDLISPLIIIDDSFSKQISEIGVGGFYGISNLKYFSVPCGERIIEGIGVISTGLFDISSACAPIDFDEGDFLINMNSLATTDYFIQNNINLFYNATEKKLQLTNTSETIKLELFSVLGKKVLVKQADNTIDVSQLQKGIYFYSLSKNNANKKGKILIY